MAVAVVDVVAGAELVAYLLLFLPSWLVFDAGFIHSLTL